MFCIPAKHRRSRIANTKSAQSFLPPPNRLFAVEVAMMAARQSQPLRNWDVGNTVDAGAAAVKVVRSGAALADWDGYRWCESDGQQQ
jgi:hypothetical protein